MDMIWHINKSAQKIHTEEAGRKKDSTISIYKYLFPQVL